MLNRLVSQLTYVLVQLSLNILTAFKITPLSVQLPHCLATHLSASDSLRPWRYTNLLTYLWPDFGEILIVDSFCNSELVITR